MLKANISVLVSGSGTNLQALIDAQSSGVLKSGEIRLVISSAEDAGALQRAKDNGIARAVVPAKQTTREEFEAGISALLERHGTELIVLAGFMYILSADFVKARPGRIINVHPSLIPAFCGKGFYGLRVHEAALEYGVKVTGATVHYVNEIPDGGEIILQKAVRVKQNDTPETLKKRVSEEAEHKLLPLAAELVSRDIVRRRSSK
ncbi:MAG: phosphoribosylglycinamide formyltransferase [Oscillospiraceae bacterium]|nr:phosphoribosylglycinamide formyltransferase [Oscillospiraceae bacterium]